MWTHKAAKGAAILLAAAIPALALTATAAPAGAAPGDATVVPIRVTGDPAKRFNLVIAGDGYTAADMPEFRANVDKHVNVLLSLEPYKTYRSYMNIYAVEVESGESGVSCDPSLDSARRSTPLKMAFWGGCNAGSVQRLLSVDGAALNRYADMVTGTAPGNRQLLALANSETYGGAGGANATASGGNALSALITPHELGHSLGGLQDEYDYFQRGVPGGRYTGGEPGSIHHTLLTEQQMRDQRLKWWRWLGEPGEAGGVIGRHEGGMFFQQDLWRPSAHSMMKSLGYRFDQVGRERMTQRIANKVNLIQDAAPAAAPVGADRVLWVETLHPAAHELDVRWTVDGKPLRRAGRGTDRAVDLAGLHLRPGTHTVTATVTDPTGFVRDPAVRSTPALTRTLTWTVDTRITTPPASVPAAFTGSTPTGEPVGARDVVYAETTHPADRVLEVRWAIDGRRVRTLGNDRDLDLERVKPRPGTHRLTATVHDPATRRSGQTLTWTVDATSPTVSRVLSRAESSATRPGRPPEFVFDESFTMKLTPADNMAGTPTAEFRVDGDGWHNYYGWPTDPDAPFLFTPLGTNIDDLIYGNLGSGGLSGSPFAERTPGYGRHVVEYRAIDAAGNTGRTERFVVTVH